MRPLWGTKVDWSDRVAHVEVYHLEPWEKGSRKLAGQVGMCGGVREIALHFQIEFIFMLSDLKVRGVGTGGIVSSAFCLLFKLFTIRLTRKQVNGLINHRDSPYIRGLGFLYIRCTMIVEENRHSSSSMHCLVIVCRYTQPPADLWEWFEPYLDDEEVRRLLLAHSKCGGWLV